MLKIAIVTSVAGKSAKLLTTALNDRSFNMCSASWYRLERNEEKDLREFDYVISLGSSGMTSHKQRFNTRQAVLNCINKPYTFDAFKAAGVDTVDYCLTRQEVPKHWDTVVVRQNINGRKAEGLSFANQCDDEPIPDGCLFSEHFDHTEEYRVMVFRGSIVGRYYKHTVGEDWFFELVPKKGFAEMDRQVLLATAALGVDYVGFDIVANGPKDFRFLEANSGATMTDEMEDAVIEYFINL